MAEAREFCLKVVGVTFNGRQEIVSNLKPGEVLKFNPEPNNPHDSNAVAVMTGDGKIVGHVPRECNEEIFNNLTGNLGKYQVQVDSVTGGGDNFNFGLKIKVSFFPNVIFNYNANRGGMREFWGILEPLESHKVCIAHDAEEYDLESRSWQTDSYMDYQHKFKTFSEAKNQLLEWLKTDSGCVSFESEAVKNRLKKEAPLWTESDAQDLRTEKDASPAEDPEEERKQLNDFMEHYGLKLNEQQKEACLHLDQNVLLLAVPGSGKTTVLITRLGYMLIKKQIDPRRILTMTFTNAAADDMKEKFKAKFSCELPRELTMGTIHSTCLKIAVMAQKFGYYGALPNLVNEEDSRKIMIPIFRKVRREFERGSEIADILNAITYVKNMMLEKKGDIEREGNARGIRDLYQLYTDYCEELKNNNLMDFDDQIRYAYEALNESPEVFDFFNQQFKYVLIDEAQDTSLLQNCVIRKLAENNNVFMVGDEDQSIYSFRGAFPQELLDFEKKYENAITLKTEENFRSSKSITDAADRFIAQNKSRIEKHIVASKPKGLPVGFLTCQSITEQYSKVFEQYLCDGKQTAILFRINASAIPFIDFFESKNILYFWRKCDQAFFDGRIVSDVRDIVAFAKDPTDIKAFKRIYFKLYSFIKKEDYLFVEENCPKGEHILDFISQNCSDQKKLQKLQQTKEYLASLLSANGAVQALKIILNDINYGKFINDNSYPAFDFIILWILASNQTSITALIDRLDYLKKYIENKSNKDINAGITLSTIHSSKGLEYDRVVIVDVLKDIFPSKKSITPDMLEEERRVMYVGMTRAKEELILVRYDKQPQDNFVEVIYKSEVHEDNVNSEKTNIPQKRNPNDYTGKTICHSTKGTGTVLSHDLKRNIIDVKFADGSRCRLSLRVCLKNDLIRVV